MQWYAVQVTTNHEKKIKEFLEKQKSNGRLEGLGDIFIPEKDGKPIIPGYIFLQADTWPEFLVNNSKFVVIGKVTDAEIKKLLKMTAPSKPKPRPVFRKGDEVVIISGPFSGLKGIVKKAGTRRSKISFFGGEVIMDADNEQLKISQKTV